MSSLLDFLCLSLDFLLDSEEECFFSVAEGFFSPSATITSSSGRMAARISSGTSAKSFSVGNVCW